MLKDQPWKRAPKQSWSRGQFSGNCTKGACQGWGGLQTTASPAENPGNPQKPCVLASWVKFQEKSPDWLSPVTCSVTCRMPNHLGFPRTITVLVLKVLHPKKPLSPLAVGRGRICPLWLLFPKTAHNGGFERHSRWNFLIFAGNQYDWNY